MGLGTHAGVAINTLDDRGGASLGLGFGLGPTAT
jgi:hypothetical protein